MSYQSVTIKGKRVHLYGLNRSEQAIYSFDPFSPTDFNYTAIRTIRNNGVKIDPVICGVAIEPLHGEYAARARRGESLGLPKDGLLDDSVCLFFERPATIDVLIEELKKCKDTLKNKIKIEKQAEYRRKFCGKVIKFSDYIAEYPGAGKHMAEQREKQILAAVDAEIRQEELAAIMETVPAITRENKPKPKKETRPAMRYAKTEWGLSVKLFSQQYGITLVAIAKECGVSYNTLLQVCIGKTTGAKSGVVELVNAFISDYTARNKPNLITQPQPQPRDTPVSE